MSDNSNVERHISISQPGEGTPVEDACHCPQELCGFVSVSRVNSKCPEHGLKVQKSRWHLARNCPEVRENV